MYKKCAERDGKIDCGEKVGMAVNSFSSGVMTIVDFAMLIWGSIVVFGAWANWTDDFDAYKANPEELNFCAHTPMMTAFVILILKRVRESLKNLWCGRRMYFFWPQKSCYSVTFPVGRPRISM